MAPIAEMLQLYGPWGVTALLAVASAKLYADLRVLNRARTDDLKSVLTDYHDDAVENAKAWAQAASAVDILRQQISRRRP